MTTSSPRLRFALLGHPVSHSISPAIHAAAFKALGLDHAYTAVDAPSDSTFRRLAGEVRRGAFAGVNVTLPYKRVALEVADEVAPSAAEVGVANVLCRDEGRLVAHNTDVGALEDELTDLGIGAAKDRALRAVILGAGGAGLSAIAACRRLGFSVVGVTSRSWSGTEAVFESASAQRARELGALTTPWPTDPMAMPAMSSGKASQVLRLQWSELAVAADLVVQATSAGMLGGPPGDAVARAVPWSVVPSHAVAFDVVYNPRVTPFLAEASSHGLLAVGGLGMLVRQAAASIRLWTGRTPPLDPMTRAAEAALAGGKP